jgi:tRNA (guanine37-N1)-methyltransferase
VGPGTTDVGRETPSGDLVESHSSPLWSVSVVTLFPGIFTGWLDQGVVSRAIARGLAEVRLIDLRRFGIGRHAVTDDYPFGGGAGMVMKPEPVFNAVESLAPTADTPVILLSPRGRRFDQAAAADLAGQQRLILLAGHYEGVDERVRAHLVTDEISVGDYVLSCGELAAMVLIDAAARLLRGALREGAAEQESFSQGLLEYPQYTRPAVFRGWEAPPVLLSGHHGEVARWRRAQSLLITAQRRPELLSGLELTESDRQVLGEAGFPVDTSGQLE